jgi:(p)ppGpp synthase/HD superfamily hydrolase
MTSTKRGADSFFSSRLELAMRLAATWHQGQVRRGTEIPYFEHVFAVAMILDRAGHSEDVVIAGLLHDAIEDTPATFEEILKRFGEDVAETVRQCSEIKLDESGAKRPWIDRKRDHLRVISQADAAAKAVILADKLHNLRCIALDLASGIPVWKRFHAPREQVIWYYNASIEACEADDPSIVELAEACRQILKDVSNERSDNESSILSAE